MVLPNVARTALLLKQMISKSWFCTTSKCFLYKFELIWLSSYSTEDFKDFSHWNTRKIVSHIVAPPDLQESFDFTLCQQAFM
jgi:hypothetical protein